MAKSSGKSTKKSGDTKKGSTEAGKKAEKGTSKTVKDSASKKKSTAKKATTKKTAKKDEKVKETKTKKTTAKKEVALKCKFCQKTMNSQKTLKIHEKNCQTKKDKETEKKLKAAMLKMKDDYEDDRESIVDQFQKREEALHSELDEMRTILRMEIDKHRKELDMIRKVEKQVAGVIEKQPESDYESVHLPDGKPRAIDMIPTPLPEIPKKIIEPVQIDTELSDSAEPSTVPVPVKSNETVDSEPEPTISTELVPEDLKEPDEKVTGVQEEKLPTEEKDSEPTSTTPKPVEPAPSISGLSRSDIEELVKSLLKESAIDISAPSADIPDLEELTTKVRQIFGRLDTLDSNLDRFNNDMKKTFEKIEKESNIRRMTKELEKVSDKVNDMMEDIGFGEDLSVTKIPPTILEIVYQATLDDIHLEIVRTKGATALEEVRLKTSGSELFKFDGRKIVTDNLARSISANHISAKQIQTTYDVLLERLLETVPHHKAKNFRGMIKVKSQEFAVDRATILTKEYDRLEKIIESTSQMVAAISAQSNARKLEVQGALEDIKNNLLAAKADQEEIELLRIKIEEQEEKDIGLENELALIKAEIEMKEQIKEKGQEDGPAIIVPGETIDAEEIIKDKSEIVESEPDISPVVLESIQKGANSKTAIVRETGLEEDDVLEAIAGLVKDKKVIEKKIGKRIKYLTPEQDLDEKLQEDKKKDKPGKKSKKEKAPAKKEGKKREKSDSKEPITESDKPAKPKAIKKKPEAKAKDKKEDKNLPEKEKKPKKTTVASKKKETTKKEEKKPAPSEKAIKKGKKKKPVDEKQKEPKKQPKAEKKKEEKTQVKEIKDPKKEEKKPASSSKKEISPSKEEAKEKHVDDALPVITKKLGDLSEDERRVLDAMTKEGMTISGIQSKVGKSLKRFALLRALRVLIDSGYVGIIRKGRMDLYQKINVKKMDKTKQNKNKQEVK